MFTTYSIIILDSNMNKKPKYSKKSAYDLSGPGPQGWAQLAEWHREDQRKWEEKEKIRRRGKGPYES
jgi:hypothetical protein